MYPAIWPSCSHGLWAFDAFAVHAAAARVTARAPSRPRLPLLGRRVEHAALHEHRSARQRERVDVFQVHGRERVLEDRLLQFRRRRGDEAVADLVRYFAMCWSSMMGYCLRTSDAASFPSCTSCFGVYFFFGSLITVCADRLAVSFCRTGAEIYQSPHSHRSATLGSTAAARRAGR